MLSRLSPTPTYFFCLIRVIALALAHRCAHFASILTFCSYVPVLQSFAFFLPPENRRRDAQDSSYYPKCVERNTATHEAVEHLNERHELQRRHHTGNQCIQCRYIYVHILDCTSAIKIALSVALRSTPSPLLQMPRKLANTIQLLECLTFPLANCTFSGSLKKVTRNWSSSPIASARESNPRPRGEGTCTLGGCTCGGIIGVW